ncbi:MAG: hypothetical protein AABY68_06210 [Pseudomonadota bacterium]
MTTNIIDTLNGVVASDSRWSIDYGNFIAYIDDSGYEKIAQRPTAVIIFAGNGVLIDGWKAWFSQQVLDIENHPDVERNIGGEDVSVTFFMLNVPSGEVEHSYGWIIPFEDIRFAGSGAQAALECFTTNKCPITAVRTASIKDPATGGVVRYYSTKTGENNLVADCATLADAHNELWKRGFIMDKTTKQEFPASVLAASDAAGAVQAMKAMSLTAPAGPALKWTDAAKANLKIALQKLADREAAARAVN